MAHSAAFIQSVSWNILAWNRASTLLMTDYGAMPADQRNLIRQMFLNPMARKAQQDWTEVAGHLVAVFRADVARVGTTGALRDFVDEMIPSSPDFAAFWHDREVGGSEEGLKVVRHPHHGLLEFEYSSFAVAGRPDLAMMVYMPIDTEKARRILTEGRSDCGHRPRPDVNSPRVFLISQQALLVTFRMSFQPLRAENPA